MSNASNQTQYRNVTTPRSRRYVRTVAPLVANWALDVAKATPRSTTASHKKLSYVKRLPHSRLNLAPSAWIAIRVCYAFFRVFPFYETKAAFGFPFCKAMKWEWGCLFKYLMLVLNFVRHLVGNKDLEMRCFGIFWVHINVLIQKNIYLKIFCTIR